MPEKLQGKLLKITYYEKDFLIGRLECTTTKATIPITGTVSMIPHVMAEVQIIGDYMDHPKYGRQFKFTAYVENPPDAHDLPGIVRFLKDHCTGIGVSKARKIVRLYGDKTLETIMATPEVLVASIGISPEDAKEISCTVKLFLTQHNQFLKLQSWHFPKSVIDRILNHFPDIDTILEKEPYALLAVKGIGFDQLDKQILARQLIQPNDVSRASAFIHHLIKQETNANGHTAIPITLILEAIKQHKANLIAPINLTDIKGALDYGLTHGLLKESKPDHYTLPHLAVCESLIRFHVQQLLSKPSTLKIDPSPWLTKGPTIEQILAVQAAKHHRFYVLSGGPGTGKSFTIAGILQSLPKTTRVALLAPTGKAAKRISELSSGLGFGRASTIHRFLNLVPKATDKGLKFTYQDALETGVGVKRMSNPPELVIVDEASMLDTVLFSNLLNAVAHASHIILVGDINQLPSVSPGHILKDLIEQPSVPCFYLTLNKRQAASSAIGRNAYAVLSGQGFDLTDAQHNYEDWDARVFETSEIIFDQLCHQLKHLPTNINPIFDVQIITPTLKGPLGTLTLNQRLQQLLNPPDPSKAEFKQPSFIFRVGDKIVVTKNSPIADPSGESTHYVVNGDVGRITAIEHETEVSSVICEFDDFKARFTYRKYAPKEAQTVDLLSLAYALTVHKVQGSEYAYVYMVMSSDMYHDLLTRSLLYTAITRAREKFILLSSQRAAQYAINNTKTQQRITALFP